MTEKTRSLRRKSRLTFALSILLSFLPIIVFLIIGISKGQLEPKNSVKLGFCLIAAIILTFLGIKAKFQCRSVVWIALMAAMIALKDVKAVIVVVGICTIVDEFLMNPLHKYFHSRYVINKEIDLRIEG